MIVEFNEEVLEVLLHELHRLIADCFRFRSRITINAADIGRVVKWWALDDQRNEIYF